MATLTIRVQDDFELVFTSSKWKDAIASAGSNKAAGTKLHALCRVSDPDATLTLENDAGDCGPLLRVDQRNDP